MTPAFYSSVQFSRLAEGIIDSRQPILDDWEREMAEEFDLWSGAYDARNNAGDWFVPDEDFFCYADNEELPF